MNLCAELTKMPLITQQYYPKFFLIHSCKKTSVVVGSRGKGSGDDTRWERGWWHAVGEGWLRRQRQRWRGDRG